MLATDLFTVVEMMVAPKSLATLELLVLLAVFFLFLVVNWHYWGWGGGGEPAGAQMYFGLYHHRSVNL